MKRGAFEVGLVAVLLVLLYLLYKGGVAGLTQALSNFLAGLQGKMNDLINKTLNQSPFQSSSISLPSSGPTGGYDVQTGTSVGTGSSGSDSSSGDDINDFAG